MTMLPIFVFLFACIESNYLSYVYIQKWAISTISEIDLPRVWLIELAGSSSSEEMLDVLRQEIFTHKITFDDRYESFLIGVFYLQYRDGVIPLNELEACLVDIVDSSGITGIDPEFILNVFSEAIIKNIDTRTILDRAFNDHAQKSAENIDYFNNHGYIEKEIEFFLDS